MHLPRTICSSILLGLLAIGASEAAEEKNPPDHGDKPVPVIFDSDMSSDWDDVGDIAVLHGFANLHECEIIGMMNSSLNGATALCMDAINTWYGRPDIPVGVRPDVGGMGGYPAEIAMEYPHGPEAEQKDFPPAAGLYRKLLAASEHRSVVIVTVGFLNNLQALMATGPDQYSPLNGMDLIKDKVKLWACAGGWFPRGDEFNFRVEPGAAFATMNTWPAAVTYTGFDLGGMMRTAGRLPFTPVDNPIRRVYVAHGDHGYPYPSWGQQAIYQALRTDEGLWGMETHGHAIATKEGGDAWLTDTDPSGEQEQAYLLEKVRFPINRALDAMMVSPPPTGRATIPVWPTNLRATVTDKRIALQWTDNAYNEDGFVIEERQQGVYHGIAKTAANVTTFTVEHPAALADAAFRVRAFNKEGESESTDVWVYSGWDEVDFEKHPAGAPLYEIYQCSNLRWLRGGDYRTDHVAVNRDSQHGKDVTVTVDVASYGNIYCFYNDADNWYRLRVEPAGVAFEKRIAGVTSAVGAPGPKIRMGEGMEHWVVSVTAAGRFTFTREQPYASGEERAGQPRGLILEVSEPLKLTGGRIGVGAHLNAALWQNVHFDRVTPGAGAPATVAGVTAHALDGQVRLSWRASPGAASYAIYRGPRAGGEEAEAVFSDITATTCVDPLLSDGTAYFYTVRAVNAFGMSGPSSEITATPAPQLGENALLNPGFEIPRVNGFMQRAQTALSAWTFAASAGIAANGSAYNAPNAPDGRQVAFLQGNSGAVGSVSQRLSLVPGRYALTFQAARRNGQVQPVTVTVDGAKVGTYTPAEGAFAAITSEVFTVSGTSAKVCEITFAATDGSGDKTSFIDAVAVHAVK